MENKRQTFVEFLHSFFDLRKDKENEYETIEFLKNDVDFKGTKMWILIFAILIASLGLNMNSAAVVIGAMLISPLMGPIIGLGLGLGITDFELVKRSIKNFAMATVISVLTSTLYFVISPLSTAQSEILTRTQPTTFDVLIALCGGFAGIIAGASKFKGNVIPGVAIATALMPPLCVAGYGLGTGQASYFFGAFYLYIINTVFIGLATFITVRLLKYPRKTFVDKAREKKLNNLVFFIVFCTIVPSVFLAYQLVQRNYFEQQQQNFIKNELNFDDTYLLSHETDFNKKGNRFYISLIGKELPQNEIDLLQTKLEKYGLKHTTLIIRQGYGRTNIEEIKHTLINDVKRDNEIFIQYQQFQIDSLNKVIESKEQLSVEAMSISKDIKNLFPEVIHANFGQIYNVKMDSTALDSLIRITLYTDPKLSKENKDRILGWLKSRMPDAEIHFVAEVPKK